MRKWCRCSTAINGKQLPEATLVCNFPAPTDTDAGLMDIGDVETFFHEFGHLMHMIFAGQQQWAGVSGISMESDFGEAPSQMLEELIRSPQVLRTFAKHYKTGEIIPMELIEKMNRAGAFGRAGYDRRRTPTQRSPTTSIKVIPKMLIWMLQPTMRCTALHSPDKVLTFICGPHSDTSEAIPPRTTPICGTR